MSHERELDRLDKQAQIIRAQGHDLDDWVVRDGDRVMRAIVYADERIDHWREQRGMPPRVAEQALEAASPGR